MMNFLWKMPVFFIPLLFVIAGCGKKDVEYEHVSTSLKPEGYMVEGSRQQQNQDLNANYAEGELESLDQTGVKLWEEDSSTEEYKATYGRSTAPLQPVYFQFDSSSIRDDQLDHLNNSSMFLRENASLNLVVEGNCDERGTADYNLALGELRAINVKKYLVNMGVDSERITTTSYGSQRPLYTGSDETSWAKNRRVDLVTP